MTVGPGDTVDLASLTTLISVIHTDSGMHNGGGLTIGNDHKLYIATGDTGPATSAAARRGAARIRIPKI